MRKVLIVMLLLVGATSTAIYPSGGVATTVTGTPENPEQGFFGDPPFAPEDEDLFPVLRLNILIEKLRRENHDILMTRQRIEASRYRIPQSGALPDPMIMVGYENEGWSRYTYGEMEGSRWMFSVSQMIPWPGKLSLKREISTKESEALSAFYERTILSVIEELKARYYELLYAYKGLELAEEKKRLLELIEEAVSSRYSSGMAPLADLTMAQTEKYMAIQEIVMFRQKIESLKAMINFLIGRKPELPLGRPEELKPQNLDIKLNELINRATESSPDLVEKQKALEIKTLKYEAQRLEYYPDLTLTGSVSLKPDPYKDMWGLTLSVNIPLFYRTKQKMAVLESSSEREETYHEFIGTKQMVISNIIDTVTMIKASQELMDLYENAFIPKAEQSLEANLSAYRAGRVELIQVLKTLNSLIDYRLSYWLQFTERQKAVARLERLTGGEIR